MSVIAMGCPNCAGGLEITEGQRIARCPYCDARSLIVGDNGVPRYQVKGAIDRDAAEAALQAFFGGMDRALDLRLRADLKELVPVWIPFWRISGQVLGVVLGQEKVGSGNNQRWVPRERLVSEKRTWVGAACDVGEFGVKTVDLSDPEVLVPYDESDLKGHGMVFEPSQTDGQGLEEARTQMAAAATAATGVDQVSQSTVAVLHPRVTCVQYPLWIARYTYKKRLYQVTIDGVKGTALYGRAPGSLLYRVGMLVGGVAVGTVVTISGPLILGYTMAMIEVDSGEAWCCALGSPLAAGPAIVAAGYGAFRWSGEVGVKQEAPMEDVVKQLADRLEVQ